MAVGTKVQVTKNYRLFARCDDNRPLNLAKHKKLFESMKKNGFYPFCPVVAFRDPKGRLVVKDGQHRLAIAESDDLDTRWADFVGDDSAPAPARRRVTVKLTIPLPKPVVLRGVVPEEPAGDATLTAE